MRFYTIFPLCENIQLTKDVGMIPYILNKEHDVDSYIVSYKNGEYPYLDKEVDGLKQVFLKKITGIQNLDILFFIITNFWKIDVLQLYHISIAHIILLNIFKILNFYRKTISYLKLDANNQILKYKKLKGFKSFILKFLNSNIDIISIETTKLFKEIKTKVFFKNLIYLPNGFYNQPKNILQKKKQILTVGRIGAHQKNTELLLEAYTKSFEKLNGYELILIGPIEDKFQKYIDEFIEKNNHIKNSIKILGLISDRELLNDYYNSANIFALTSRYEGFALVYLEAIQAGCRIISSDITPAYDIVKNDKIGYLFENDNIQDLSEKLIKICNEEIDLKTNKSIQKFAYKNFYWPDIINKLFTKIKSI